MKCSTFFKTHLLTLFLILFCSSLVAHSLDDPYCAFCDSAVIERQKFYEDDLVVALYTHKPVFPGHCLVIPKRHVRRFEELSSAEAGRMMDVLQKVHLAVQKTFHTNPYVLLQKNGREAGQTVPHVHFHYIPRKTGDTSGLKFIVKMYMAYLKKPITKQEMEEVTSQLKQAMHNLGRSCQYESF